MKGITFGDFHSYDDFSLILNSKTIGSAEPKIETVEIPGADGVLDISEYFGDVKYKNRSLSFEFSTIVPQSEFLDLFSEVQNNLHGRKLKIVLDDDPNFYYIGRIIVSPWKADKNIGKITIDCDCEPYKYKLYKTIIVTNVQQTATVTLANLRQHVVPTFTTDAEIQISFGTSTYSANAGTFIVPEIVLVDGNNSITFTGNATVTVEYQEGGL